MESLVLFLAEFVGVLRWPAWIVAVPAAVLAIDLARRLVGVFLPWVTRRADFESVPTKVGHWLGHIAKVCAAVVAVLLVAVSLIDAFFLRPVVAWIFGHVERSRGVAIQFDDADGNLWMGQIEISGLSVRRHGSERSDFDLRAEKLVLDVGLLHLLTKTPRLQEARLEGVRGSYVRKPRPSTEESPVPLDVDVLRILDADVAVSTELRGIEQPLEFRLEVDSWTSQPMRSHWTALDLLFHSTARGRVERIPFEVQSVDIGQERETRWKTAGVPVSLSHFLGPPLTWIRSGTLDVELSSRWPLDDRTEVPGDCRLELHDVQAEAPGEVPWALRLAIQPAVAYINGHAHDLPLEFDFRLDRERFSGKLTPESAGLNESIRRGVLEELSRTTGIESVKLRAAGRKATDTLNELLGARRP